MHRETVIRELGGLDEAARWLGISNPRSISNWLVDEHGNITARRICDACVAALVRKKAYERQMAGEVLDAREVALLALPGQVMVVSPLVSMPMVPSEPAAADAADVGALP